MREKNMYVVTPRCAAAAAVVSAVVLRRPAKECTHPYSMLHRRLPTAGIEVAPHYHQLLVLGALLLQILVSAKQVALVFLQQFYFEFVSFSYNVQKSDT